MNGRILLLGAWTLCLCAGLGACGGNVVVDGASGGSSSTTTTSSTGSAGNGGSPSSSSGTTGGGDVTSDLHNYASCGHDCLGGACVASTCQPVLLASGQTNLQAIAVGDGSVFFTTNTTVSKVSTDGGPITTLASGYQGSMSLALDATTVYWVNNTAPWQGQVLKTPMVGGPTTVLASGLQNPIGIAVADAYVYWTNDVLGSAAVLKIDTGGAGPITSVVSGLEGAGPVAVQAGNVYVAGADAIYSAPTSGGATFTTLHFGGMPGSLAVDATRVYWGDVNAGHGMSSLTLASGSFATLAPTTSPQAIAVDASGVYFRDEDGSVSRMPAGGGPVTTLVPAAAAGGAGGNWSIAVDASSVYWANMMDETIMKVAKP